MRKTFFVMLAALAYGAVCADGVFTEDFEKGAARWHLPSAQWRVEDGAGRNGTKGLVLEYGKDEIPTWIERNELFPVEPGEAYRLEAWIRDADFKASERTISISLAVYDEKNAHIKGAGTGTKRVADNIVHPGGWYCVKGTSRPLPANAAKARLYIWAREGSYGKVMFDDFRVTLAAVNPLDQLCCNAYRDEAAEGNVRFSAAYTVNPVKHDVAKLRAELRYAAADGGEGTAMAALKDGVASVTLPVSAFAFGTNAVRLVLKEADGAVLGESACDFSRVARLPERKVFFDSHKRTIVDGKPFFPLGMYWSDINAKDLAVYTNSAFNCLVPYKRPDAARMDMCAAAGVKVIFPVCGFYELLAGTNAQKAAAYKAKYIDGQVEMFRAHPALLAWYLADEIPETYAYLLAERNMMCREKDPDHPTWVVLNGLQKVRPLVAGYDAVGQDPYPVGCPHKKSEISLAAEAAAGTRRLMYDSRAVWQVPQAFNWAVYAARTVEWRDKPGMRMPTRDEMRSMTWQAIANGANGIVYYSFYDAFQRGKTPEENARQWADVCAVAREVKEREGVLLAEPGPDAECSDASVAVRTWMLGGTIHILAVNCTSKPVTATIRIEGARTIDVSLQGLGVEFLLPVRAGGQ